MKNQIAQYAVVAHMQHLLRHLHVYPALLGSIFQTIPHHHLLTILKMTAQYVSRENTLYQNLLLVLHVQLGRIYKMRVQVQTTTRAHPIVLYVQVESGHYLQQKPAKAVSKGSI